MEILTLIAYSHCNNIVRYSLDNRASLVHLLPPALPLVTRCLTLCISPVSEGRPGRSADGAGGSGRSPTGPAGALSRSRSANSLKQMSADPDTEEHKLTVLSQLFWLSVCLLESDYEYEYLLAMRLLEKVGGTRCVL